MRWSRCFHSVLKSHSANAPRASHITTIGLRTIQSKRSLASRVSPISSSRTRKLKQSTASPSALYVSIRNRPSRTRESANSAEKNSAMLCACSSVAFSRMTSGSIAHQTVHSSVKAPSVASQNTTDRRVGQCQLGLCGSGIGSPSEERAPRSMPRAYAPRLAPAKPAGSTATPDSGTLPSHPQRDPAASRPRRRRMPHEMTRHAHRSALLRGALFAMLPASLLTLSAQTSTAQTSPNAALRDGYMDHDGLRARVRALAGSSAMCTLDTIGESREGRELFVLTLSDDHTQAHKRPALLITAGLDGRHWVGTETAVRVAERLLEHNGASLSEVTVYVIPRVNPDGTGRNFGPVNEGHIGTLRPVDLDRDGVANEDGPNDLNADGVITMMRLADPGLAHKPTHLPDPDEPRLMKTPDWAKGERATHALFIEGIDEDGDGRIAEDGAGGVDLDRNFMHLWPEYALDAGPHQLSEPESMALARFVIDRPNITMAITYGRHDNVVNVPDHRGRDINRRIPTGIDEGDKALFDELSKLFKETTGQKRAPKEDIAGSFHAWLYAQRAVTSVATVVWGRPDIDEKKPEGDDAKADEPVEAAPAADPNRVAGSWAGSIALPAMEGMGEMPDSLDATIELDTEDETTVSGSVVTMMGELSLRGEREPGATAFTLVGDMSGAPIVVEFNIGGDIMRAQIRGPFPGAATLDATRVGAAPGAPDAPRAARAKGGPSDAEEAAWLKYSDSRGGVGFVEWESFDHPQLGEVEIGGWVPGFKMNPPASELDDLAEKQADFAVALIERRPRLRVQGPEITRLGPGLYEVRLAIVNDGWLPTNTAMGEQARAMLPTVLRLTTPLEQIVSGQRVDRAWRIEGFGRHEAHWMLAVEDGAPIEIELLDDQLGDMLIAFSASETTTPTISPLPEERR
ncbi:MAG: hypothetical protein EA379_01175 [Phycisphaerales bacterium]|nr:MAG: hypothetical protein EA379_01175 [Phycisphaerales bacterium]